MLNVLVLGLTENYGGLESFIINYYRHIDSSKVAFSFLCHTMNKVAYEDELLKCGAKVLHIHSRRESLFLFRKELHAVLNDSPISWDAVWVNSCNLVNIDYLIFAKRCGIPCRIIHSHNSSSEFDPVRRVLHSVHRRCIAKFATDFWACSTEAAKWLFPDSIAKNAVVINNAIDVHAYSFNDKMRNELRDRLGICDDCTIIGNVGRLHYQKNQSFAIEVFREFSNLNPNSKLVLVGDGDDELDLREQCKALGLEDKVIFTGVQGNIQAWLSAFDVFLFPSRYEGLGIALLEAQANGLPVLASETVIPDIVKINQHYLSCSLDASAELWAAKLDTLTGCRIDDMPAVLLAFKDKGFDINCEADKLECLFQTVAE